jgi:hypothetical protein
MDYPNIQPLTSVEFDRLRDEEAVDAIVTFDDIIVTFTSYDDDHNTLELEVPLEDITVYCFGEEVLFEASNMVRRSVYELTKTKAIYLLNKMASLGLTPTGEEVYYYG